MSESLPHAPKRRPPVSNDPRVGIDDLARVPAQRLALLLLECAAEDAALPGRLHETADRWRSTHRSERPAIIGESAAMRRATILARRFGRTDEPVLITGESGSGKALLARAIHDGFRRARGPFVTVNCAAIPSGLVASELFGYENGAVARNPGRIESAKGGTLFLEEIGDMPIDLQDHLLRFLQERQIRRLGGRETIGMDVRVISATNVRLDRAIAEGRFREDLFHRLNGLSLKAPPLRERVEDIGPLAYHFLRAAERDFNRRIDGFSADAMAALRRYRWPGNVRELRSVVRHAVVIGDGTLIDATALIGLDECPVAACVPAPAIAKPGSAEEREMLVTALDEMDENITSTADALHVSRVTLYRMLRRHGIVLKRGLADAPVTQRRRRTTHVAPHLSQCDAAAGPLMTVPVFVGLRR